MYSQQEIDDAVASGVLSPAAASALRNYIEQQRTSAIPDEEQFRLLTGFNDIFVSIAAAILLFAVGFIGQWIGSRTGLMVESDGPSFLGPLFVAATSWGLALFFTAKRRMHRHTERTPKIVSPLGFAGGFLDAAGGGGWGAIVTSNLLVQGSNPRKTIGTVNTAEFFLTITISATFLATFTLAGSEDDRQLLLRAIIGLVIGGVIAAPFGAMIAKRVNPDRLLTFVGALVTATSTYALYRALS